LTAFAAMYAKRPSTSPDRRPITGPVNNIIRCGESASGDDAIIPRNPPNDH
jgi:hypothetical protein